MKTRQDGIMKASLRKPFFSRFKSFIDNPIVGGLISIASHPLTGLVFRIMALAMAASNPISLAIVIVAQVVCVAIDASREYREARLKERARLVDRYGIMVERLEIALKKLEPDAEKRKLIRKNFDKSQGSQEYEKTPRRGLEKGKWQYRIARFIEWGTAIITDSISTHGLALIRNLPIDLIPEVFTMGRTSEAVGTYVKREKALEENREMREKIIEKAKKFGVPSYNKSTVQLGKHLNDIEKDLYALEKLASNNEEYSHAKFTMYKAEEKAKLSSIKPESRGIAVLKSIGGAVFGSKEDYSWVLNPFGTESKLAINKNFNTEKNSAVELVDLSSSQFSKSKTPTVYRPEKKDIREKAMKQMIDSAVVNGTPKESKTPTTVTFSHTKSH